jgi:tRNA modification GTPase
MDNAPRVAILSPMGRGALATVVVRGRDAVALAGRRFTAAGGRPLTSFSAGRVVFGRFRTAAAAEEELVVGLLAEDEVEIHCHGGTAAVRAIVDALLAEGCVEVAPAQWVREIESDQIAAAAALALTEARTERTAAILLDQYRGALRHELTAINGHLEKQELDAAARKLHQLTSRVELGLHLTRPWKIVLAGRPNVGKSSLINAMLGYERAIVFPQPGTTRDVLTAAAAIDGWPVEFADTAGLRRSDDPLESEGVARARAEVLSADAVLFVADTTAPWDDDLHQELQAAARRLVIVHNKCDLALVPDDGRPKGLAVSAKTGVGIDQLCQAIADRLAPQPPARGSGVPFTAEQAAAIKGAEACLEFGDIAAAQRALAAIT